MAGDLRGRVAVVTGAAGGIGRACCEELASRGAAVALLDLNLGPLRELEAAWRADGVSCAAFACDVADEGAVEAAAERVREELGPCAVLVNTAGLLAAAQPLAETSLAHWNRTLAVNLTGAFLTTRCFGAQMLERGAGAIVNIGSSAVTTPNGSPPYGVSKAGLWALTRHTAVEWGPRGVRANMVSPGFVLTALSEPLYAGEPGLRERRIAATPLRRLGTVADMAAAVAYLAGDAAAFVSGQELVVDGGFMQTTLMHSQPQRAQYGGRT